MENGDASASRRVALLFTRFPVATETFLQREVLALRHQGKSWLVLALWPSREGAAEGLSADETFSAWRLVSLLWWIPFWVLRKPAAMRRLAEALLSARAPNLVNVGETLLGMAYAIVRARSLNGRVDHFHAVWASAPATAAWALRQLIGTSYSMAGHAYDLFEDGGDGLLETKIPEAAFIRTSTNAGRQRWLQFGAEAGQVHVIRRGLLELPEMADREARKAPFKLLAVGRLVEKMGHIRLLELLHQLKRRGLPFTATVVGGGPLRRRLMRQCDQLGLLGRVDFTGPLPFREVTWHYREADLLLFTGQVARSGDRAGFPNTIGEAMAWGVPVCASPVGAVTEGIQAGKTGLIIDDPVQAAADIVALLEDPERYEALRTAARSWVDTHFDANRNMDRFVRLVEDSFPA
jgi:glycosyltransferase involved in cell wall biosynthesis